MENNIWKPQVYIVIHIPTGKKYIGSVWEKNKTYIQRFEEHLNHKGSIQISWMIKTGIANREDFNVELYGEYNSKTEALKEEGKLITSLKTFGKGGLNSPYNYLCIKNSQQIYYFINVLQYCKKILGFKYEKTNIQKRIEKYAFSQDGAQSYEEFKSYGNVKKGKGVDYRSLVYYPNNVTDTDGWKKGREKYKERMKNNQYTEKELKSYENRSNLVKNNWDNLEKEQRDKKSKGLKSMNERMNCPYCDYESTTAHVRRHIKNNHKEMYEN